MTTGSDNGGARKNRGAAVVLLAVTLALVPIISTNLSALGIGPMPLLYDIIELPRFVLSWLGALGALVAWAWSVRRGGRILLNPALTGMIVLAAIACVSTVLAEDRRFSILGQSERLEGLASWVLYALLFFVALQCSHGMDDLRLLAYALVGSATLLALYGLAQSFGWDPTTYVLESPGFDVRRAFATFGNPNFFAGLLVLAFPVSVALAAESARPARARWLWSAAGVIAGALFATFTRGAWFAAALEVVMLGVLLRRGVATLGRRGATALAGCGVLVAALAAGALGRGGETDVLARLATLGTGSVTERLLSWVAALSAVAARPLFGYGPDRFLAAFRLHRPDAYVERFSAAATINNAHSWPLNTAATLGPIAAIVLVAVVTWVLSKAAKPALDPQGGRVLYAGVWVGCLGFAVHMLFNVAVHGATTPFWVLLGALAVPLSAPGRRFGRLPGTAVFAGAAILLACVVVASGFFLAADHIYLKSRVAYRQGGDAVSLSSRAFELNPLSVKYARGHAEVLADGYLNGTAPGKTELMHADEAFRSAELAHPGDYATGAWHAALLAAAEERGVSERGGARGIATRTIALDRQSVQVSPLAQGRTDAQAVSAALSVSGLP